MTRGGGRSASYRLILKWLAHKKNHTDNACDVIVLVTFKKGFLIVEVSLKTDAYYEQRVTRSPHMLLYHHCAQLIKGIIDLCMTISCKSDEHM